MTRRARAKTFVVWRCPDCHIVLEGLSGNPMKERIDNHRRAAHGKGSPSRNVRISDLARELSVESSLIVGYLVGVGYPSRLPSSAVTNAIAREVREHFCSIRKAFPRRSSKNSVGISGESTAFESAGIPVERFLFRLLPPGTWSIEDVIAHYRQEAECHPGSAWVQEFDESRLLAIRSLKPAKCYVGEEQWRGYVVFEFGGSDRVALECPRKGNATYILWGDWKRMVAYPKSYIWEQFPQNYRRIIHGDEGRWLARTERALRL
jgi:hypothetical protein